MGRKEKFIIREREILPFGYKLDTIVAQEMIDFIYELARQSDSINVLQKNYILTLQNHLKVRVVNQQYNLNELSKNADEPFFDVFCEFCFLEKTNFDFLEDYQDILDLLYIEKEDIDKIKKEILKKYRSGAEHLILQYGKEFRKDDEFVFEERVKPELVKYHNVNHFQRLAAYDSDDIGKVWEYSELHINIRHKFYCEQEIEFRNCIIFINDENSYNPPINQIYIKANALFENCIIMNNGNNKTFALINDSKIDFKNCSFYSCEYFLKGNGKNVFKNCTFKQCKNFSAPNVEMLFENCNYEQCVQSDLKLINTI